MPFVLKRDNFIGWKGAVGATVKIKVVVALAAKFVDVTYNNVSLPFMKLGANNWTTSFTIVAGDNRIFFTFANIVPDTIDIYEVADPAPAAATSPLVAALPVAGVLPSVAAAPAPALQQEIARVVHANATILAPLIEGV